MTNFPVRLPAEVPASVRRDIGGTATFVAAAGLAAMFGDIRSVEAALGAGVVAGIWAAAGMWRAHRNSVSAAQHGSEVTR